MDRRRFLLTSLAGTLLSTPRAAEAQQAGKAWRIGFVRGLAPPAAEIEAFRQGLRELGYVEGKNLDILFRWAEGRDDRLPSLVAAPESWNSRGSTGGPRCMDAASM